MSQQDRHLTTEQLSAFLDEQLTEEERAAYSLHLKTCEQCRQVLARLRQTVALLRALPQPALPRSFVLPADTVATPSMVAEEALAQAPISITEERTRRRAGAARGRNLVRLMSGLVAVLGILIFVSACPGMLPHNFSAASTTSSNASSGAAVPAAAPRDKTAPNGRDQPYSRPAEGTAQATNATQVAGAQTQDAAVRPTPTAEPTATAVAPQPTTPGHASSLPAPSPAEEIWLTLSAPLLRVGLGILLFVAGLLGLLLLRRSGPRAG